MVKNLLNALKGISGEYEITRLLGGVGVGVYIFTAPLFVLWDMIRNGAHFDTVAFCAAYPTGLGIAIGAIAGSAALKDRNVATAIQTRDGTSAPVPPPPETKE